MNYYRCKCGKRTSWSSYGPTPCQACDVCGVTLASQPDLHHLPEPHLWSEPYWTIDRKTGEKWQDRTCRTCDLTEKFVEGPRMIEAGDAIEPGA